MEVGLVTEPGEKPRFGRRELVICLLLAASPLSMIGGVTTIYVTLPAIEAAFGAPGTAGLLLSGYLFAFLVGLPVAGHSSDRLGGRLVFTIGMTAFAATSVIGSLASSAAMLIAARAAAGAAAAFAQAGAGAAIAQAFPHAVRGRAYGTWIFLGGAAGIVSPLAAGLLLQTWGWRLLFVLPAAPALAGAVGAWWWLDSQARSSRSAPFDWPGLSAFAVTVSALVAGLRYYPPLLAIALLGAVTLVLVERGRSAPLIDLGLLGDRYVGRAIALDLLISINIGGTLLVVPFIVEWQLGLGPGLSGLALALVLGLSTVLAVPSGVVVDRLGPRGPTVVGCAVFLLGYVGLATWGDSLSASWLLGLAVLIGAGIGVEGPAVVKLCLEGMEQDRVGRATAMVWMARRCGDIIGVSAAGVLLERIGRGEGIGFSPAYLAAAGVAVLAVALALSVPSRTREVLDQAAGRALGTPGER